MLLSSATRSGSLGQNCQLSRSPHSSRREQVEHNLLNHMISSPEPHVFEVARGRRCQVHHQTGGRAPCINTTGGRGALRRCHFCARRTSHSCMAVPKPGRALGSRLDVPFDENHTGSRTPRRKKEVLHLYIANVARVSNLDQDLGVTDSAVSDEVVEEQERGGILRQFSN